VTAAGRPLGFDLAGTTLEACNCDAICPCRRIDGRPGGRSTHGECTGLLTWRIDSGTVGDEDVSGLAIAMAIWYSDDEPGSPWRWQLHVDDRADAAQHDALADVWQGRLGGPPLEQFPWARKPSHLLGVERSHIELDHAPGRGWLRIGRRYRLRIEAPFPTQSTVSCVIPGHHRAGRELVAAELLADDDRFRFSFSGTCGYESTFHYTAPPGPAENLAPAP
jgi:hypothetical protein